MQFLRSTRKRWLLVSLSALYVLVGTHLHLLPMMLLADAGARAGAQPTSSVTKSGTIHTDGEHTGHGCSCGHCDGPTGGDCTCSSCSCGEAGTRCAVSGASGPGEIPDRDGSRSASDLALSSCGSMDTDEHAKGVSIQRHPPIDITPLEPDHTRSSAVTHYLLLLPTGAPDTPDHIPRHAS